MTTDSDGNRAGNGRGKKEGGERGKKGLGGGGGGGRGNRAIIICWLVYVDA